MFFSDNLPKLKNDKRPQPGNLYPLANIMKKAVYDRDYYQWLTETVYLLSEGRLAEMDVPKQLA